MNIVINEYICLIAQSLDVNQICLFLSYLKWKNIVMPTFINKINWEIKLYTKKILNFYGENLSKKKQTQGKTKILWKLSQN